MSRWLCDFGLTAPVPLRASVLRLTAEGWGMPQKDEAMGRPLLLLSVSNLREGRKDSV